MKIAKQVREKYKHDLEVAIFTTDSEEAKKKGDGKKPSPQLNKKTLRPL